jgi:hypothetical protein
LESLGERLFRTWAELSVVSLDFTDPSNWNYGDTLLISVNLKLTKSDSGESRSAGTKSEREMN